MSESKNTQLHENFQSFLIKNRGGGEKDPQKSMPKYTNFKKLNILYYYIVYFRAPPIYFLKKIEKNRVTVKNMTQSQSKYERND